MRPESITIASLFSMAFVFIAFVSTMSSASVCVCLVHLRLRQMSEAHPGVYRYKKEQACKWNCFRMVFNKLSCFLFFACRADVSMCMEPLAALAVQPTWQAGEPIAVNVDYDVPAFGPQDAESQLQSSSNIEYQLAAEPAHSHNARAEDSVWRAVPTRHNSASFLSTRVLPVDADRIKKSLYLTQSLRSPPQASINVVMREDVRNMRDTANYMGMLDQTHRLQNEFKQGLADMSNGHV